MKNLILILSLYISVNFYGQTQIEKPDKDSLVKFRFDCKEKTKIFKIPCGYLTPKYSEHEKGPLITINYPDSSHIKILCGTYSLLLSDNYRGEGFFERKEYIDNMTIIYEFVKKERIKYFEKSFNKIAKSK